MTKRLAIFLCILAFASLQAHNLISHHHDEETKQVVHFDRVHHHDGDHDSPMSHNSHDAEFGKSLIKPEHFNTDIHHLVLLFCTNYFLFETVFIIQNSPAVKYSGYRMVPHLVFILHDLPLRAPPSVVLV